MMNGKEEMENGARAIGLVLKSLLEEFGFYLGFDNKTKEIVLIKREDIDKSKKSTARIPLEDINIKE